MRGYTQLAQEERYQIYALLKAGHNQQEIAELLERHPATISREIRRNHGLKGYRPRQAHMLARHRLETKACTRIEPAQWRTVKRLLREDWSPEQVSEWLEQERSILISHEWIYQYVLKDKDQGGSLYHHLRGRRHYRKRYGSCQRKGTRGGVLNTTSIDERPTIVDRRTRFGDWEVDTVIGKGGRQVIVSLTERKSRLALFAKVTTKTAGDVRQAIVRLLRPLADWVHTLTSDNGGEFAQHEVIAKALGARFYFAHPFASWERGLNEHTNGLLRQYFPKGHDFAAVTNKDIQRAMDKLNNRPRKCLGFKTPNQVFFGINPPVALVC